MLDKTAIEIRKTRIQTLLVGLAIAAFFAFMVGWVGDGGFGARFAVLFGIAFLLVSIPTVISISKMSVAQLEEEDEHVGSTDRESTKDEPVVFSFTRFVRNGMIFSSLGVLGAVLLAIIFHLLRTGKLEFVFGVVPLNQWAIAIAIMTGIGFLVALAVERANLGSSSTQNHRRE